jgi:hypothetical protein
MGGFALIFILVLPVKKSLGINKTSLFGKKSKRPQINSSDVVTAKAFSKAGPPGFRYSKAAVNMVFCINGRAAYNTGKNTSKIYRLNELMCRIKRCPLHQQEIHKEI